MTSIEGLNTCNWKLDRKLELLLVNMTITKWQKQNPILYQTEIAPFKNSFHD